MRDQLLLKRYLDATRSELFFSSAVIFVEGVAEQFIIPSIAKEVYGTNLTEQNISVVPIHSRYFDPFLEMFQDGKLEIKACAIIDGDWNEVGDDEQTTSVKNAKSLEVKGRVNVFPGTYTLEVDLFPDNVTNNKILETCFVNLGHSKSFKNLMATQANWTDELLKRIDGTIKKGRFAQELSLNLSNKFIVPQYIKDALEFIIK
ncbi:TOPRIM nucleotidyl transferase/hydrolase domain-containing protein [Desulfosediminicola flagellatus]|uniref:TOPRIM nucleotidyl transferase/hydrolase domain-containing protein n=1 Tax=Desulfosediminicola flagellatus TaxID=2569541 RepID=UPI0010AC6AAD|nr:ATP-dependent endonuclease [Desulfosediminicola flagellatus]